MLDVAYWQGIPGFMDRIRVGQEKSRNRNIKKGVLEQSIWRELKRCNSSAVPVITVWFE